MKIKNNLKLIGLGIAIAAFVPVFASALSEALVRTGYYTNYSGYYNPYGYYSGGYSDNPYGYSDYYGNYYGAGLYGTGVGNYGYVNLGDRGVDRVRHDGSSHREYNMGRHGGGGRGHR